MADVFVCDYVRTPIGRYGGSLSSIRADDLAALPLKALLERNASVDWASLTDVVLGCANQAGEDNRSVARMALLLAGLPERVSGTTINRLCGSGMDAVLGLAFTRTGPLLYPVFGTLLGWLGVALTGSDTSSNVLFGNLQRITALKLGLDPVLMASANSTGGVMGKMIDAQSIVVAAAATGEGGKEGSLLRAVFGHSLALALLVAAIVWLYAHVLPGVVVSTTTPG